MTHDSANEDAVAEDPLARGRIEIVLAAWRQVIADRRKGVCSPSDLARAANRGRGRFPAYVSHGQLERGVRAQGIAVVGFLVSAGDRQPAEAQHGGESARTTSAE